MIYRVVLPLLVVVCVMGAAVPVAAQTQTKSSSAQKIPPPKIVKHVPPLYPDDARQARIQGVVVVEATIGADGKVNTAKVIQSIPLLDTAALDAVRQWEYTPTLVNGVATPVIMTVRVNFSLTDPSSDVPPPATSPPAQSPAAGATPPPPVPPPQQQLGRLTAAEREWEKVSMGASQLALDGKTVQAMAMVQKYLTRYPNVADAHYLLATFSEQLAGFGRPETPEQRRYLESAAKHYARSVELQTAPDMRFVITWKLAKLYGTDQLDVPVESERYARRLVEEHPARAEAHMVYAQLLREKGELAAAADVMRKGRAAAELPIPGLLMLMQYSMEQVQASRALARDAVRALLDEAIGAADTILARPRDDDRDYRLATMGKAMALSLMAERVEQDRQRRLALLIESDRWGAPIDEHKNGAPPPARKLNAAEAADVEWRYVQSWSLRLIDEAGLPAAIASFEKYLSENPAYVPIHLQIAELSVRAARETQDEQQRAAYYEKAAQHFQRMVESSKDAQEHDGALLQLLDVYGPSGLNRPAQQESILRTSIKRAPAAPLGYYQLAAVLMRTGRGDEADKILRSARGAIRATAASRADMASELITVIRSERSLADDAVRRLFAEASALVSEAEKLNSAESTVLEAKGRLLLVSADRVEKNPALADQQREEGKRLMMQAIAIYEKGLKKPPK